MKFFNVKTNKFKLAAALVAAGIVFGVTNPSFARLDELIMEDALYSAPPAVNVSVQQSFYKVKPGDTLWDIARLNGLSIEALAEANDLNNRDIILAGQVLKVPEDCTVHRVQTGETLEGIAKMYRVDINLIATRNGLTNIHNIGVGQQLFIPHSIPGYTVPSRGMTPSLLSWPLLGALTSGFGARDGSFHHGIDIAADEGAPMRAAAPGTVVFAGPRGAYGLAVIIDHGGGLRTLYAHCSRLLVTERSSVDVNTIIALAGNTGNSRGPHLHLEVLQDGVAQNPLNFLNKAVYYG